MTDYLRPMPADQETLVEKSGGQEFGPNRRILFGQMLAAPFLAMPFAGCANISSSISNGQTVSAMGAQSGMDFMAVAENRADDVVVPEGFGVNIIIKWGDPLFEGVAPVSQSGAGKIFPLTRASQEARFGAHNDFLALFHPVWQYPRPDHHHADMILCANHESISRYIYLQASDGQLRPSDEEVFAAYAAMGVSVVGLSGCNDETAAWTYKKDAHLGAGVNRRITPFTTVGYSGPAAAHPWLKAAAEITNAIEPPTQNTGESIGAPLIVAAGTFQNCAGGYTPWGTYLTSEENINNCFFGFDQADPALANVLADPAYAHDQSSFGYASNWFGKGPRQYDLRQNPYGPSLYGWVVEIDPLDPHSLPVKRTSLGRKKGECATCVLSKDGHAIVYSGDDQAGEFVYKFVSREKFNPHDRRANFALLEDGDLYAAQFLEGGTGRWLKISADNVNAHMGETIFTDDGDCLVHARRVGRLLGATPMDRPEDVESPTDGTFMGRGITFIMCTKNTEEHYLAGNVANPRRTGPDGQVEANFTGHMVAIEEEGADHAAINFHWHIAAVGGDPAAAQVAPTNSEDEAVNLSNWRNNNPGFIGDRFANPDNITFIDDGRAFVATDGNPDHFNSNDGVYLVDFRAGDHAQVKRFLTVPIGAEATGPLVTPDQKSLMLSVQHPGSSGLDGASYHGGETASHFPDGKWPRDSVVRIHRKVGGRLIT